MRRSRLVWQVALPFAAILVVALAATTWQASTHLHRFHFERARADLASRASLAVEALAGTIQGGVREEVDPLVKRLGVQSGTRVTVIAADGTVLGESNGDPALMDNHGARPEVSEALMGRTGAAVRYSETLRAETMYHARPVYRGDTLVGVVRTGLELSVLHDSERSLLVVMVAVAILVAALLVPSAFWVARRVSAPLEELEALAERYASGDLEAALPAGGSLEVLRVAEAMKRLASELDSRIAALVAERSEQEAMLASMVEGVLAVDGRERVMALNQAAARLFEVDAGQVAGRSIQEVARNADLQRFVADALRAKTPLERDVALHGEEPRYLQAHGAPVRDHTGRRIGVVVVLNDVTRLRRLETVRRDFVANVSHELKTPVTSIKGFLETLLAGALADPETARRFLEIAARQADRLGAIIDDLLLLSRIEQESEHYAIEKTPTSVRAVVTGAVEVCSIKAEQKNVALKTDCEADLRARINGALVEQALVNLIDNAIKYSDSGGGVEIRAFSEEKELREVVVQVRDSGPGIEAEHLPRLFERFYRVDKARSRALGGTGLGLAIVKHIAQAQGGSVSVESKPGAGTMFTLRFPAA